MVLKIGETVWRLHFHVVKIPQNSSKRWDTVTKVLVHTGPCIETHVEPKYCVNGRAGEAKCSKLDQFNRRVGARLALTRALEGLPEETRTALWKAYWEKVRRPKETSAEFRRRLQQQAA